MVYYVDPFHGDDSRSGGSADQAWRTLARVSRESFRAGDQVLLARGGVWAEGVKLRGRGAPGKPIVLGAYGEGPRPRISGGQEHAITADEPISAWRISGLELTSTNGSNPTHQITGGTCGVHLKQAELCESLTISDCAIHDTSGPGVFLVGSGEPKAVFTDTVIEHCEVYNASCGIQFLSEPHGQTECFSRFRIAHVVAHDIGGDGIVPFCSNNGVIEHCTAYRTGMGCDPSDHSPIAIWYAWANKCVIQHCHAYDNRTGGRGADGGGFDLDGGCTDCIIQYNYSHDNEGAGYLICSWDPVQHPCTGCICRYNVSVNDGLANDYASIHFWQNMDCLIYNNTCITRGALGMKFATSGGDAKGNLIANNIFVCDTPEDVPMVGSAFDISGNRFRNNCYWHLRGEPRFDLSGQDVRGLEVFMKAVKGEGEISAEPLLADAGTGDFHLRPGSPCRGAGLRLPAMGGRDYHGAPLPEEGPVDIGCAVSRQPMISA
jgi:hypothetical protein